MSRPLDQGSKIELEPKSKGWAERPATPQEGVARPQQLKMTMGETIVAPRGPPICSAVDLSLEPTRGREQIGFPALAIRFSMVVPRRTGSSNDNRKR
jgi:hypothetical protein